MIVLAERDLDVIGCAITSNPHSDGIILNEFQQGNLPFQSKIKYWHINTIEKEVIERKIAKISNKIHYELLEKIQTLFCP